MSRLLLPAHYSRREFLRHLFWTAGAAASSGILTACPHGSAPVARAVAKSGSPFAGIGPLQDPDANGLRLPAGFTSRVVAVSNEPPALGSPYLWHFFPDGGACYPTADGGWIYTSNSEVPGGRGGCGALKFASDSTLTDAYSILTGTSGNCAGGKTPWGTWISCEETAGGMAWECNPFEAGNGTALPALGLFNREAVAIDPFERIVYQTEDAGSGRFYRFVASATDWPAGAARPALQAGHLQALRYRDLAPNQAPPEGFDVRLAHAVVWEDVQQPDQDQAVVRTALGDAAPGTPFRGGEGIWYREGIVYFATKGDNRIWAYDVGAQTVEAIYDFATSDNAILSGVDNLTVSEFGDVLVSEDGGDMQVCVILPDGRLLPLLQATDHQHGTAAESEITGPAFSPDGTRLYFSAQRNGRNGTIGPGITFEVTMPFSACPSGSCP